MKVPGKTVFIACTYIILTIYCIYTAYPYIRSLPYESDEISWFYHTKFYDLLTQGKIFEPYWHSLDAYDHPPLSKYVYGLYLRLHFGDYAAIRENLKTMYGEWSSVDIAGTDMPHTFGPFIITMRSLTALITVFCILLLSGLTLILTGNIFVAVIHALLLVHNGVFMTTMIRAVSDSHYIFLLTVSFMLFGMYCINRKYKILGVSAILGALSMSSKLTGVLYFLIVPAYLCIEAMLHRIQTKQLYMSLGIVIFSGTVTWFIVNPTLYPSPVYNSYWYFVMRQSIMDFQKFQEHNIPDVLRTIPQRSLALTCTLFNFASTKKCGNLNLTQFPLINYAFTVAGFISLTKQALRKKKNQMRFFLFLLAGTVITVVSQLTFNWTRYFLPVFILFSVLFHIGLANLLRLMSNRVSGVLIHTLHRRKTI